MFVCTLSVQDYCLTVSLTQHGIIRLGNADQVVKMEMEHRAAACLLSAVCLRDVRQCNTQSRQ